MTIAETRRWLVGMSPDELCGRMWHGCNCYTIKVLSGNISILQTTEGPLTYGGLAHCIVTRGLVEGEFKSMAPKNDLAWKRGARELRKFLGTRHD